MKKNEKPMHEQNVQNYCSSSLNVQIYDDVISNNPVDKAIQKFFPSPFGSTHTN